MNNRMPTRNGLTDPRLLTRCELAVGPFTYELIFESSGKSSISRRLSRIKGRARFSSDMVGHVVARSSRCL